MFAQKYITKSIEAKQELLNDNKMIEIINKVSDLIIDAYRNGKKVLTAGNGGSTADAQHIAGELVGKFNLERNGLPAISLTNDMSIITAVGNDYSFDRIFARQIQANGNKGDIFIAISTSGNSKNILCALEEANKAGLTTVLLTGNKECEGEKLANYTIKVPSSETPHIQECHVMIGHLICAKVEHEIFG